MQLKPYNASIPTTYFPPLISPINQHYITTHYSTPITLFYSPLTTHHSLPTPHHSLPTPHHSLPTPHHSLLITHYPLPTTHHSLPTTHHSLLNSLLITHYSSLTPPTQHLHLTQTHLTVFRATKSTFSPQQLGLTAFRTLIYSDSRLIYRFHQF
jgi:hypothetical protein